VNHYGPTECAVNASYHVIRTGDESRAAVPIGIPVWNTTLYVLDSRGALVPLGIPGEMWIGGVGVARGYHGAPELTAERFVPDPFDSTPGARMYRTGDVVCRRADGSLEMLGRVDFQVKVRGNRVELEEVEAVIRLWPGVGEVVVTPWPAGTPDADLAAYVVPTAGQRVEAAELRGHLRATLPGYMVPRYIDVLPALPRTPSRKVDRAALPAPSQVARAVTDAHVAPRTRTEGEVAAIWEEQLETGPVGVHADFFDLGGHSLLALRVLARIHERLDVELEMRVLFDAPTVEALAAAIDAARSAAASDADLARERDARSQR
jgi:acyl carrier protein